MIKKSAGLIAVFAIAAGLGYAAGNARVGTMTPVDELRWQPMSPGSPETMAMLWGDRNSSKGEYAMLLRLPAGHASPVHAHTADYHGVTVSGVWRHFFDGGESRDLPAGSHVFQPGLQMHGDSCVGPEDCVLLIVQNGKGDFIPKQ